MGVSDRQIVGNGVGIGVNFKFLLFESHSFSLQRCRDWLWFRFGLGFRRCLFFKRSFSSTYIFLKGSNLGVLGLGVGGGCGIGIGFGWGYGVGWGSKYIDQNISFKK